MPDYDGHTDETLYYMLIYSMSGSNYMPCYGLYEHNAIYLGEYTTKSPSPPGFTRLIVFGKDTWDVETTPPHHYIFNKVDIMFPMATQDWGTIISFFIYDYRLPTNQESDYQCSSLGPLSTPTVITDGDTAVFLTGDLKRGLYCSYQRINMNGFSKLSVFFKKDS